MITSLQSNTCTFTCMLQTLDEEPQYTDEELKEFERQYEEEQLKQMEGVQEHHAQPGEINVSTGIMYCGQLLQ